MALVTVQRSPTPSTTSSPCVSEADSVEEERRSQPRSISESFLTVKGAALFLPRGNGSTAPRISHRHNKHAGDLQQHLQAMFTLLRPEDNIRLAVRLESAYLELTRYMVVVSTNGRQDTEESIVLGMDFFKDSSTCTMGLVLPLWSDTLIHLDGDGGFSVSTVNRIHIFKPVSVQAMWSALQSLHKACDVARTHNYYPGSLYLTWISYYESRINSNQAFVNEWNAMQDVQSHRSDSPVLFTDVPTERERTERLIKTKLREVMMQMDLENVTSKEIRTELEMQMVCNLREFKEYIDNEMIVILRQMDNPTEIFEHVYLGSEWNASNLEDLQSRGIRYILNITREIDNFFPGIFEYYNIRVYDEEATDLLAYWNDTYKFISKAKKNGSKCLVHCKMGISRSASTVIAYAMKEYGWNLDKAYSYVKEKRTVTKPNVSFMRQLEEYQGILLASKQRHNKLWRSHSDSDLSDHRERINKSTVDLNRRDSTSTTEMPTDPLAEHLCHPQFSDVLDTVLPGVHEEKKELNSEIDADNEIPSKCNPDDLHNSISSATMPVTVTSDSIAKSCAGCSSDTVPLQDCHNPSDVLSQQGLTSSPDHPIVLTDLEVGESEKDISLKSNSISMPLLEIAPLLEDHKASQDLASPVSTSDVDAGICSLSTDRIDFFSAREKFIELSQESGARAQSHSKTEELGGGKYCATKVAAQETFEKEQQIADDQGQTLVDNVAHARDKCVDNDAKSNKENLVLNPSSKKSSLTRSQSLNVISVKELVTEIESSQSSGLCQSKTESITTNQTQTPKRNTVHELPADFHLLSENGNTAKNHCANESLVAENNCKKASDLYKSKDNACQQMHLTVKSNEDYQETAVKESAQNGSVGHEQVPKWCPGSVKRATQEFEERLKQEQEHQSSLVTLPIRKNSRIDGATANEFVVTNKNEAVSPELSLFKDKGKERIAEDKCLLLELSVPQNQEPVSDSQSRVMEHPLESRLELEQAEPGSLSTVEHRIIHCFETSEELDSYTQLPKKIEIIEFTHVFKPPTSLTGEEKIIIEGESPGKENEAIIQSADDLEMIEVHTTDFPCQSPLPVLDAAGLAPTHQKEIEGMTFKSGGHSEEVADLFSEYEIDLFVSDAAPLPLKGLEYQTHVLHLEGVTESSTDIDAEILGKETIYSGLQEADTRMTSLQRAEDDSITLLNCEDLELSFSRFDQSIREMQGMLNFSNLDHFSHGSNIDRINHLSSALRVSNQRSKEIEAKIRQAGLTTPSLMKRSASIAKLGYLELSRDDLFKRGLDSSCQAFSDTLQNTPWTVQNSSEFRAECAVEDEPSKKKCVSISILQQDPQSTMCFAKQLKTSESIVQSNPVEKPLIQYAKAVESTQEGPLASAEENLPQIKPSPPSDTDVPSPTPQTAIAPRQHHHRNHPLKRLKMANEKKHTANPLYNTM
ncbi:protein phosphatase Slingshot homolog 2 isoform X2 [Heterodontus francisci]|uniref:protein phosphatase Slingshot homolog 2 isoform X2 n=1 Tax=Heterodontus francisci TaxID=7792 RepID=UPI00355B6F15